MERHERPVNSKCQRQETMDSNSDTDSEHESGIQTSGLDHDLGTQILKELKHLSGRIQKVESKVEQQQATQSQTPQVVPTPPAADAVLPTVSALKQSTDIQREVDFRLQELRTLNEQGKFKSQRGGSDTIYCKNEVPWPHNYVLTGNAKSRASYDSLSMSQWVAGFCQIIKDQNDPTTKNQMLDYMSDLMEDSHDFGWQAAKGCHAVLLVKMEEGTIAWNDTNKIDRVRRAHAQKVQSGQTSNANGKKLSKNRNPIPCRFYQKGSCGQTQDHENGGQTYLHVCALCFKNGKSYSHPSKDCKKAKNEYT